MCHQYITCALPASGNWATVCTTTPMKRKSHVRNSRRRSSLVTVWEPQVWKTRSGRHRKSQQTANDEHSSMRDKITQLSSEARRKKEQAVVLRDTIHSSALDSNCSNRRTTIVVVFEGNSSWSSIRSNCICSDACRCECTTCIIASDPSRKL